MCVFVEEEKEHIVVEKKTHILAAKNYPWKFMVKFSFATVIIWVCHNMQLLQ